MAATGAATTPDKKETKMDKSKWTYKKLGEICEIVTGSTPKTEIPSYWGGNHYWVTPAELDDRVYIDSTERTITDEALSHSKLTLMPVGTVLLSSRAPIGKVAITRAPMYCNQGFKNLVCSDVIYNKFLYWFLKINTDYLNSLGRGATFKEISKAIVSDIKILLPPVDVQHDIADELDQLSELISLKQQQLKEYENLCQSLYYETMMPIDKEWKSYKLGDICEVVTGSTPKTNIPTYWGGNNFWVTPAEIGDSIYISHTERQITEEALNHTKLTLMPIGTVLLSSRAPIGKVAITSVPMYCNQGFKNLICSEKINNKFLYWFLKDNKGYLNSLGRGATFKEISKSIVENIQIPLPPISLQRSFANKVQSVEQQENIVKKSIAETNTLLDSRIQEYFG